MDWKSCCVSFINQLEDEPHTENNQIYIHPLQPYSPMNNFFHAQQISNGHAFSSLMDLLLLKEPHFVLK